MARFQFKALDANRQEATGVLEAPDRHAAVESLSRKFELVIDVREVKAARGLFTRTVSQEDLMVMTQQLAVMLRAGINLRHALELVDSENPALEALLAEVASGINEGKSLSEMFSRHPGVFSKLYLSMVRAGEAAGKLPLILAKLAEYLENSENLRRKVKGALVYPTAILGVSFLMAVFIFMFGVQQFQEIYRGLNAQLPPSTRIVLGVADFMQSWWPLLLLGLVALVLGLRRFLSTGPGELVRDRLLLTLPGLGPLMQRLAIARFSRTLSTLYAGGVPILASLDLVASSMGNRVMEDVIRASVKNVQEGEPLVRALRESHVFTRMAISMIATGEESGTLDTMLDQVASFYEVQVEAMLRNLVSLLEPAVIVGIGIFVAFLIMALGLPMMNLVQHL